MNTPLTYKEFRWYCLQYLPEKRVHLAAIYRAYYLEGYRTMNEALKFITATVILYHLAKTDPEFKTLSKKKKIAVIQKVSEAYDPAWIEDVPGMKEVMQKNFPDLF